MSKDIIVLAPNGRRQTVKCTLNTTILQILEDVCKKQGYEAADYELRHHNKPLDLSNTIRFSNLPNKASLEMVESETKRQDSMLTIALQLENGERRLGDFSPQSSLYTVLETLAAEQLAACRHPTVVYMRHEVCGEAALRDSTLKHMGLTGGRAVLRLIDKSPEELKCQPNVSSVLQPRLCPQTDEPTPSTSKYTAEPEFLAAAPGPSQPSKPDPPTFKHTDQKQMSTAFGINPMKLIKDEMRKAANVNAVDETEETEMKENIEDVAMCEESEPTTSSAVKVADKDSIMEVDEEQLERRLNIEREVTFLGDNKAVAFAQPDGLQRGLAELPDEFFELTVEEVRRLYRDLRQNSAAAVDAPLLTAKLRDSHASASDKQSGHKHVVVRVQFPERMVLQGVFAPSDTIGDVQRFTRQYLRVADRPFYLYTTPTREILDPEVSLQEARFVPCVLMHFRWAEEGAAPGPCLSERVYTNQTSSDAAAILASKYRAQARRKMEDAVAGPSKPAVATTAASKDGKTPKWFKLKP